MRIRNLLSAASLAVLAFAGVQTQSWASSHREAPGITEQPKIDGTDFYMFRSYEPGRENYVTFIANYQPLQAPYGGPNYFTMDPDAIYEIHIDNDGDAIEDLTFQFDFDNALRNGVGQTISAGGQDIPIPLRIIGGVSAKDDANIGETESYTLSLVTGDRRTGQASMLGSYAKPLDNVGDKTFADYPGYAAQFIESFTMPGCAQAGRVFVGQRAEAFAVNLGEIFDLVNLVPIEAGAFPGGIAQDRANDDLVGKANVTSLALEVPIACLGDDGDNIIGAWTTASLPQAELEDPTPTYEQTSIHGGAYVQQSRLSNPLVNEVVIGLPDKDLFNASEPKDDGQFASYVTNPALPEILNVLFLDAVNSVLEDDVPTLAPTNFPRADLVAAFLTGLPGLNETEDGATAEMLRLNFGVDPTARDDQSTFGVAADDLAGFPNGRRPGDDTVDIALRVAMGRLCHPVVLGGAETQLPFCSPSDANVGTVPFTDGAPISASELKNAFPYLNDPIPGSPN